MKYLNKTKDLVLILNSNNTNIIKWWIDAAYAAHPNMRSHAGGCMSLGGGVIHNTSIKQKLNVKSSTEAELVAVDDVYHKFCGLIIFYVSKVLMLRTQ